MPWLQWQTNFSRLLELVGTGPFLAITAMFTRYLHDCDNRCRFQFSTEASVVKWVMRYYMSSVWPNSPGGYVTPSHRCGLPGCEPCQADLPPGLPGCCSPCTTTRQEARRGPWVTPKPNTTSYQCQSLTPSLEHRQQALGMLIWHVWLHTLLAPGNLLLWVCLHDSAPPCSKFVIYR